MFLRRWPLLVLVPLFAVVSRAQETERAIDAPGQYNKFLTANQLDRWSFEGEKDETIIAHVVSKEFDPILELGRTGEKDDKVLLDVDDPGSESCFSMRLPEKGQYKIRVHAFKYQGGGNYTLEVLRFMAKPLSVGEPLIGTFNRHGKSYHYFQAVKGQIVIPKLMGTSSEEWKIRDFKGRKMTDWAGSVLIEDSGECSLIVSGKPGYRYDLIMREARQQELPDGKELAGNLEQGAMDVWSFQGKPGDFRLLEVEKAGELNSRLIYIPQEKKSEQRIADAGEQSEMESDDRQPTMGMGGMGMFGGEEESEAQEKTSEPWIAARGEQQREVKLLPVASRGAKLRFAAILGGEGKYQFQLLAETSASYKLTMRDPSVLIESGGDVSGNLSVGGAAFYSFKAAPGQLYQASVTSQKFVPVLRLYDTRGNALGVSDANVEGLEGRLTHMVMKEGLYRLQVSSLGNGGGGDFHQALKEIKLKELQVGGRGQGTVQPGATEFWVFSGKEGQTVFLNVRSSEFEPTVSLFSPDGVQLAADDNGSSTAGSLLALKLPRTGRYTVRISSSRGAGEFTIRLIDGD
jgi:hypothetical protein